MKTLRLTRSEKAALKEYIAAIAKRWPNEIQAIFLFGSKARGQSHPESDTDIALIIRKKSTKLRFELVGATFDPIAKYGIDISPILITAAVFRTNSPLVKRIKEEGIELWNPRKNLLAAA